MAASTHWATDGAAKAAAMSVATPFCQATNGAAEATSMFGALPSHSNGAKAIVVVSVFSIAAKYKVANITHSNYEVVL
jgi:copper(I)-binding protein